MKYWDTSYNNHHALPNNHHGLSIYLHLRPTQICIHVSISLSVVAFLVAQLINYLPSTQEQRRQWHPTPVLLLGKSHGQRSLEGCSPRGRWGSDTTEQLHFHFHASEKEMATHFSVLAWRIPGMGEPGGLPSLGSHRIGHDWSDLAAATLFEVFVHTSFAHL